MVRYPTRARRWSAALAVPIGRRVGRELARGVRPIMTPRSVAGLVHLDVLSHARRQMRYAPRSPPEAVQKERHELRALASPVSSRACHPPNPRYRATANPAGLGQSEPKRPQDGNHTGCTPAGPRVISTAARGVHCPALGGTWGFLILAR